MLVQGYDLVGDVHGMLTLCIDCYGSPSEPVGHDKS